MHGLEASEINKGIEDVLKLIKGLEYTQGKTSIAVKVADGDKTRSVNLTELVKNRC